MEPRKFDPLTLAYDTRRIIQSPEISDGLNQLDALRKDPKFIIANHLIFVVKVFAVLMSAFLASYYFYQYKPILEDPTATREKKENVARKWNIMFGSIGYFPFIQGTLLSLIVIIGFKLLSTTLPKLLKSM